ncbi:MAG: hypothetical protein J6A41_01560 [Ruminiclostridium sp.]|nr:hypothetical protein [Ruminiclostridium sp.]
MELITSGTKFYLNGQSLYGLKSTPDMGGSREKKQITNLLDTAHRYIAGLYKYDELTFGFYYNSDSENPNVTAGQVSAAYSAARAIECSGASVQQKLEFPDGTYFTWSGQISTRIKSMNPDGVMEFSIISIPDTKLTHSLDT